MRFTWLSNAPFAPSGYGSQTRLFLPLFAEAGHEPACIASYGLEGGMIHWRGIPVYPRYQHPYALDVALGHTHHHRAEVLFTLLDSWVLNLSMLAGARVVPWYPVDSEPLAAPIRSVVSKTYDRITMSRFGEQVTRSAGLESTYIPHGFDPMVFYPRDKAACRERLGWEQDKFIALMVAANKGIPSRKAFAQHFAAFAQFATKHPDAWLYVHSSDGSQDSNAYDLLEMAALFGIEHRVSITDRYEHLLGLPDSYVSTLYNAADVLLNVSMGEGFGIPIIEAQACGTPVIVGDWTAMSELVRCGWKVERQDAERFLMPIGSFQYLPHPSAIAECLDYAYSKGSSTSHRERAAELIGADYAAGVVMTRHWLPFLAALEERIAAESGRLVEPFPVEVPENVAV